MVRSVVRSHVTVNVPVTKVKVRGSRRDGRLIFMSLLRSREGDRPCVAMAYVKHSTLNSAIEQELRDRRVEDRANATSSA